MAAAAVFALRLPHIRVQRRRLIVAQQMAGGDPPQEMTGGSLELEESSKPLRHHQRDIVRLRSPGGEFGQRFRHRFHDRRRGVVAVACAKPR